MNFLEGSAAEAGPPEPLEPEDLTDGLARPVTPCGVGADLKASPLPPASLLPSVKDASDCHVSILGASGESDSEGESEKLPKAS